jgi:hypothetical protein
VPIAIDNMSEINNWLCVTHIHWQHFATPQYNWQGIKIMARNKSLEIKNCGTE